jgi:hypothetical protein
VLPGPGAGTPPGTAIVAAGQYLGGDQTGWEVGDLRMRDLGNGNVLLQFAAYTPDKRFLVLGSPLFSRRDEVGPLFAVAAPDDDLAQEFREVGIVVRSGASGFDVEISDSERLKELLA